VGVLLACTFGEDAVGWTYISDLVFDDPTLRSERLGLGLKLGSLRFWHARA
jgi:hypothetical protein